MLFKLTHLQGIKSGKIVLAIRKWKKPRVKKGSLIKTPIGQVEILDISEIIESDLNLADAKKAGYEDLETLKKILQKFKEGQIYKIELRFHSADPRIALREKTEISEEEFEVIAAKLQRLDKYSKQGAWTLTILKAIQENPKLGAKDLAELTCKEKDWLKLNIRKLKNLGLTISHEVGYTISPLGKTVIKKIVPCV